MPAGAIGTTWGQPDGATIDGLVARRPPSRHKPIDGGAVRLPPSRTDCPRGHWPVSRQGGPQRAAEGRKRVSTTLSIHHPEGARAGSCGIVIFHTVTGPCKRASPTRCSVSQEWMVAIGRIRVTRWMSPGVTPKVCALRRRVIAGKGATRISASRISSCLLYTSDAADEE